MNGIKILVVDDEEDVRVVFQEMLESEGYEVKTAESAVKALEAGKNTSFNLLLTDIRMPEMDGLQLTRTFREANPNIGAILVTGYPDVETARAGIHQGVFDYIVKPIKKADLCAAVENALKKQSRNQILERTAQELEAMEKTRTRYVDVLAHELRTSLTPVLGCAEMLMDQLKDKPDKLQEMLAHALLEGAKNMRLQLENLLMLTRLESGSFTLKIASLDPSRFFREMALLGENMALDKKQHFMLEMGNNLPLIQVDRLGLEQVVINLLENAVKFTPENGQICLKVRSTYTELVVTVQDDGPRLSGEELRRLQQPYWRSEVDRQRLPGSGLSMAIFQRLIELHKGRLWIENGDDSGKIFAFALPVDASNFREIVGSDRR